MSRYSSLAGRLKRRQVRDKDKWLKGLEGGIEAGLTLGTGMAAEVPAGLAGLTVGAGSLAAQLFGDETASPLEDAIGAIDSTREAFTFMPRGEEGIEYLGDIGEGIESAMAYEGLLGAPSINDMVAGYQDLNTEYLPPAVSAGLSGLLSMAPLPGRVLRHVPDTATPRLLELDRTPKEALEGPLRRSKSVWTKPLKKPAVRHRERLREGGETVRDLPDLPEKVLRPEDLKGGVLVPHQGDRTLAGGSLSQVGGVPLTRDIALEGGPGYSLLNEDRGLAWASNMGTARGLQRNIDKAASETGLTPYGAYTTMSPLASNFSTHVADVAIAQLDNLNLSKKAKKQFDDRMRARVAPLKNVESFVGIDSPELRSQLMGTDGHSQHGAGKLRTAFAEEMAQTRHRNEGFPVMDEIYDAVNNPRLAGAGLGEGGYTLFKGAPESNLATNPEHSSYTHGIAGKYAGKLADRIPMEVMFPKLWEQSGRAVNRSGGLLTPEQRINQIQVAHTYEPVDQQWIDSISQWLEQNVSQ